MALQHLARTATIDEVAACVREHGHVIIDELVSVELMDRIQAELQPYFDSTAFGHLSELGFATQRTGSLVARSPSVHELILQETFLGAVKQLLSHSATVQLALTEVTSLAPGAEAQFFHQDEVLYDNFPFPIDYEVFVNSLWALTDYTEEMGATRVVPGSHKAGPGAKFSEEDSLPVEMERGSVLLFSSKIYHGGGANRSDRIRRAIDIGFSVGWVRQVENQFLSCPIEIARTLPKELVSLMGYASTGGYGLVGDREDALTTLGMAKGPTKSPEGAE